MKKQEALSYIDELYPHDAWIHVYTDGSATNATQDDGAESIIYLHGGQQIENSAATGKHCTNYGAEVKALEQGAKAVDDLTDQTTDVVFLTNSRSALDALHNQSEPHLSGILHSILGKRRVVLQWIPVHCGIKDNEMADKLAKKGAAVKKSTAYTWLDCCCTSQHKLYSPLLPPRNGGPFLPFFNRNGLPPISREEWVDNNRKEQP